MPAGVLTPDVPRRQVRARHDGTTLTVYQAYPAEIAELALRAGRFVPPFKRERMTWIKPSFLWMAYRCGWATKPGQEVVLAVDIDRSGFEWAIANSCLSDHDRSGSEDRAAWRQRLRASPVRVQWDPERDLMLRPQSHRAIQVGLSGEAVARYVDEWIQNIRDVTGLMHDVETALRSGDIDRARALLPVEDPYLLSPDLAARIGADTNGQRHS